MITSFQLKFGRAPGLQGEPISASPVVVFVGPNNSGKSKVLTEIEGFCKTGATTAGTVILERLTFAGMSPTAAAAAIQSVTLEPMADDRIGSGFTFTGRSHQSRTPRRPSEF